MTAIAPPGTSTLPLHSSVTAIAPATITTVTDPAETCYEIADGQVQCVPAPRPKLKARTPKTATALVTLDDRDVPCANNGPCGGIGITTQQSVRSPLPHFPISYPPRPLSPTSHLTHR